MKRPMKRRVFTVARYNARRTTATRVYTHAIIGRAHYRDCERHAHNAAEAARKNLEFALKVEALGVGTRFPGGTWAINQLAYDNAKALIQTHGIDLDAYARRTFLEALHDCREENAKAALHVLQWSSSAENARRAIGSWKTRGFEELAVVPTDQWAGT